MGFRAAGYLPGMMIPHTRFFGAMSLAYLALGAVWGGLYIWHWAEVFTLQHCISAVIVLSMMEMSTWRAPSRALQPGGVSLLLFVTPCI